MTPLPPPLPPPFGPPPSTTATASMVLGIAAVVTFLVPPIALGCGALAIVLAVRARRAVRHGTMTGAGQALAGLICGIIGTLLAVVVMPAFIYGFVDGFRHDPTPLR